MQPEIRTPNLAHVDWLAFTYSIKKTPHFTQLRIDLEKFFGVGSQAWIPNKSGWFGYKHRIDLGNLGLLAYGGQQQKDTIHIELNAHACAGVPDWHVAAQWLCTQEARITRLDVAHDDLLGKSLNIPRALEWYKSGEFTTSGRPPAVKYLDDFGTGSGRTLYIGSRKSGKLLRCYEKGKQLGNAQSPWVRVEVEWRAQDRQIPLEAILRPSPYLAGAYPCLSYLDAVQDRIKTKKLAAQISYERMVSYVKTSAGQALNVMCIVNDGDVAAVIEQVSRPGIPKRLTPFLHGNTPPSEAGKVGANE